MEINLGQVLILKGKTNKGKNRIRENGQFWTVGQISNNPFTHKKCMLLVPPTKNIRWIDLEGDVDFEIVGKTLVVTPCCKIPFGFEIHASPSS